MAYPPSVHFKKGQSGNPKGRPRLENSLSSILRKKLEDTLPDGRTKAEALIDRFIEVGLVAEATHVITSLKNMMDRLEGTAHQSITAEVNTSVKTIDIDKLTKDQQDTLAAIAVSNMNLSEDDQYETIDESNIDLSETELENND